MSTSDPPYDYFAEMEFHSDKPNPIFETIGFVGSYGAYVETKASRFRFHP